ncbi:MAG: hypothetical protein R6W78_11515 [Bacteroidales bacterium]
MKSGICIILGGVIFCLNLQAQFKDYDLSTYKLPDLKRHQLDLLLNLSGNYSNHWDHLTDTVGRRLLNNNNVGFNPIYNFYRNSENYQGSLTSTFGLRIASNTLKDSGNIVIDKERGISENFNINSENRFYLKRKLFIESNVQIRNSYFVNKREHETENALNPYKSKQKITSQSISTSAELLIGTGRIEPVQDMRLALYILEELQKANRLKRIPTEAEINEFARLISTLRNERFFDNRLKRVHELEQLDTFLVSKSLISDYDATHFAIIMDNWDYAKGPNRSAGWRISTGIGEYVAWNLAKRTYWTNNLIDNNMKSKFTNSQLIGIVKFNYAKPINLYWQLDFGSQFSVGKNMQGEDKIFVMDSSATTYLSFDPFCTVGYYPNSRSNYIVNLSGNYYNWIDKDYNFGLNLNISGNYYISQQVRLNFAIIPSFVFRDVESRSLSSYGYNNGFDCSVYATFTYSIL